MIHSQFTQIFLSDKVRFIRFIQNKFHNIYFQITITLTT